MIGSWLVEAQKHAISKKSPLVCLICIEQTDVFREEIKNLKALESELSNKNISLVVLIDKSRRKLESAISGLKPIKVFSQPENSGASTLLVHPISWGGSLLKIDDLLKLDDKTLCI